MTRRSLTIVLPAYNEEARVGAAFDELFVGSFQERCRSSGCPPIRTRDRPYRPRRTMKLMMRHSRMAVANAV